MASVYDYKVKKRDRSEYDLADREGKVVGRFGPTDKPEEMEAKIKELM
jgi:glutathione peroxidase-family protein